LSCEKEDFFIALDTVAKGTHRILKPTKVMAWLIGDQCKQKKFIPVGFRLYEILTKYLEPIDLVCIARHNQTSNTPIWHERAKRFNFYLRGFKYLMIMRKTK
jgi:hypothetical protein